MSYRSMAVAVGVAVLGLTAGGGQPAEGQLVKCEKNILKATTKLNSQVVKALTKCSAGIRKDASKKGITAKTADKCEKNLAKVFNIGGKPGKGAVNKALAAIDKSFRPGKEVCSVDDLNQLGLLSSGVNAPGGNTQDFMASALIMKEVDLATREVFANMADFQDLLTSLTDLTDCEGLSAVQNSKECTAALDPAPCCTASKKGECRPNLCTFQAAQNPDCRTHACRLSASSGATLLPAGIPVALQDRITTLSFCQSPATLLDLPVDFANDYRAVFVGASRTLVPPPTLPGLNVTVCVDQMRGQGWCDCNGGGAPFEPDFCLDHVTNFQGGACADSGDFCLTDDDCGRREECVGTAGVDACGSPLANASQELNCQQPDGSPCTCDPADLACIQGTECVNANNGGPCHPGTFNGQLAQSWAGASGAGDCVLLNTISFKLLPAAICSDGINPVGICTTPCNGGPCAPDASCTNAGGVVCIDPKGADGVACTSDDLLPPGAPTTVPFTTGNSRTTLLNMAPAGTEGSCSGSSLNPGMNCVSDQDCPGGACTGATLLPNVPIDGVNSIGVGPGNGLSCGNYDSSSLSGLQLVGSFPATDGNQTGDTITTFTLDCE